jgi:hypothetical protein
MRVLIACEFSGRVRDAFAALGHDAWSCDLLPSEKPGNHIQGDVLEILNDEWDLMVAHPPCTYFAVAGLQYLATHPGRLEKQQEAAEFVKRLWQSSIPKICVENPIGQLPKYIGAYSQIIRMWQFGHAEAHKPTCLWLKGLPLLESTSIVEPLPSRRYPNGKVLSPWRAKTRLPHERSRTFHGVADAMAQQWGNTSDANTSSPRPAYAGTGATANSSPHFSTGSPLRGNDEI